MTDRGDLPRSLVHRLLRAPSIATVLSFLVLHRVLERPDAPPAQIALAALGFTVFAALDVLALARGQRGSS